MYIPEAFREVDRGKLLEHMAAHPFATVITAGADGVQASHLPLLVDDAHGLIRGHLARDNAQCAHLAAGADALAVFHGPHGYVSPSVYEPRPANVTTWNYVAVHVRG